MWVQGIYSIQHTNQKNPNLKHILEISVFLVSVLNKVDFLYPHVLFLVYFMVEIGLKLLFLGVFGG
jgi:hypothetical protein